MPQLLSTLRDRSFYRYTFEIRDKGKTVYTHTMLLNPGDMSMDETPRNAVIQTLGGAYVTDFGQGIPSVTMSGITGYHARQNAVGVQADGYTEWKAFRDKLYRYYVTSKSTQIELYWFNWEDGEYYKVIPQPLRLTRSKTEPLLYRYEFRFVCIQKLGKQTMTESVLASQQTTLSDMDLGTPLSSSNEILSRFSSGNPRYHDVQYD